MVCEGSTRHHVVESQHHVLGGSQGRASGGTAFVACGGAAIAPTALVVVAAERSVTGGTDNARDESGRAASRATINETGIRRR